LFLILGLIPVLGMQAQAGIEIYAYGHKYDSLKAYLSSKNSFAQTSASLNSKQEEYVRQAAKKLGIVVDFNKERTFQISPKKIPETARHKLYVLSVENGMVGALREFYPVWGSSDTKLAGQISSQQLQGAIEKEVKISKGPKLLISEPGKVRIMDLNSQ